ncbi:MAG TPA: hypothetical protein VE081_13175 [Sporichthyaceae bacterium]|nr:hypothetical protein [Sporichthyaceae bacterium]
MRSADPTLVTVPLLLNPGRGIVIPLMTHGGDRSGGAAQRPGADVPIHGSTQGIAHEIAAPPRAGKAVDLGDQLVVQLYVHAHV